MNYPQGNFENKSLMSSHISIDLLFYIIANAQFRSGGYVNSGWPSLIINELHLIELIEFLTKIYLLLAPRPVNISPSTS